MIDPAFDPPSKAASGTDPFEATSCLAWGILSTFVWIFPKLGLVPPIVGLCLARRGWHAPNRDRARVGAVLCAIALAFGVAVIGLAIGVTIRPPIFHQIGRAGRAERAPPLRPGRMVGARSARPARRRLAHGLRPRLPTEGCDFRTPCQPKESDPCRER